MNQLALALYVLAVIADLAGLGVGLCDLRTRIGRLSGFHIPPRDPPPMIYNEHPDVAQLLAAEGPQSTEQRLREGFNEVIGALVVDRATTDEVDRQLAALEGVGQNTRRLGIAFGLVVLGTALGAAGNVVSSTGTGSTTPSCSISIDEPIVSPTTLVVDCS